MKATMAQRMAYLGAGAGLVVFVLFGIMPGMFVGGAAGLSMAGALVGTPVEPGIVARVILAVSMLTGVLVTGLLIVTATAAAGWMLGTAADVVGRKAHTEVRAHS